MNFKKAMTQDFSLLNMLHSEILKKTTEVTNSKKI